MKKSRLHCSFQVNLITASLSGTSFRCSTRKTYMISVTHVIYLCRKPGLQQAF